jgi:hypothetical protein
MAPNSPPPPNRDDPDLRTPGESSKQQRTAELRNQERLEQANVEDNEILSKYLSSDRPFVTATVWGPDDNFEPPGWLMENVRQVATMKVETPSKPSIAFAMTTEAATHNSSLLEQYDYDFDRFISSQQGTTLGYGSEFRPISQLELILGQHPNFPELAKILADGMDYRFATTITEETRLTETLAMMERGNHKSAESRAEHVEKALSKDVLHGFSMPFLRETVPRIPGAMVQPFGMAEQLTLTESGDRVPKYRLTQDLSFSLTEANVSVNSRIDMEAYPEMIYGWCLLRILHFIAALRAAYPTERIFITKYDYSDAYRRIAHAASAAIQSVALFAGMAFLALRLTFGGSPNPPTWCLFSEMVTDLANELLLCQDWEPSELSNPDQNTAPAPKIRGPYSTIAPAQSLAVGIPLSVTSRVDGFIDDLICVFLNTRDNLKRAPHAVPLAMFVTSRPHAGDDHEPIQRRNILSLPKLVAEGSPDEWQVVLGWLIDTHLLLIRLPTDKYDAWKQDVLQCLQDRRCTQEEIDTLVGRLNHTATVIPLARHFLGRLRDLIDRTAFRQSSVLLNKDELHDLRLWLALLEKASIGISINLVVVRRPTCVCWSDACPAGIGGYSLTGRAWRIKIPSSSILFMHPKVNNLLEFIGMVINIWVECIDSTGKHECILALGDNTSAIGWLFSTSKFPANSAAHQAHLVAERQLSRVLLQNDHCLASQHLKGELNTVADLLSFSGSSRGKPHPIAFDDPPDDVLTQRFHTHFASQIPENFKISPLPRKILSWIVTVLQMHESYLTLAKRARTKPTTDAGADGLDSAPMLASGLTLSSILYPSKRKTSSVEPSSPVTGLPSGASPVNLQDIVNARWSQVLSERPQATWLRRFGSNSNQAPYTSKEERPCAPQSAPC